MRDRTGVLYRVVIVARGGLSSIIDTGSKSPNFKAKYNNHDEEPYRNYIRHVCTSSLPSASLRTLLLAPLLLVMTGVTPMNAKAEQAVGNNSLSKPILATPEGGTVKSEFVYGEPSTAHIYDAKGKLVKSVEYYPAPRRPVDADLEYTEVAVEGEDPINEDSFKLGTQFKSLSGRRSSAEVLLFNMNLGKEYLNKTDYTLEKLGKMSDDSNLIINEYTYNNNKIMGTVSKDLDGVPLYYTKFTLNQFGKITKATDFDSKTNKPLMLKIYNKNSQVEKMYPFEKGRPLMEEEIAISYYDTKEIKSISKGGNDKVVSYYSKDDGLIIKRETYKNKKLYTVVEGNNNPKLPRGVTRRITLYNQEHMYLEIPGKRTVYKQVLETIDPKKSGNSASSGSSVADFAFPGFENVKRTVYYGYFKITNKTPQIRVFFHRLYMLNGKLYDFSLLTAPSNNEKDLPISSVDFLDVNKPVSSCLSVLHADSMKKSENVNRKLCQLLDKRYEVNLKTRSIIDKMPDYEKKNKLDRLLILGDQHKYDNPQ